MIHKPEYIRLGIKIILSVWILVSFAALVGMYQLWWQRERVLYVDKDVIEQRAAVFERAGLPAGILKTITKLPEEIVFYDAIDCFYAISPSNFFPCFICPSRI